MFSARKAGIIVSSTIVSAPFVPDAKPAMHKRDDLRLLFAGGRKTDGEREMHPTILGERTRNWRRRGFSCAIWTDPPGQEWSEAGTSHTVHDIGTTTNHWFYGYRHG